MKRGLASAAFVLTALALATPALAGKADNFVRFASEVVLDNADPYFTPTPIGNIVAENVWDTLIYRDPETNAYKGNLATSWKWLNDTTLELDLRRGVKFHNGAEFDADDVLYTLTFVSTPPNNVLSQVLIGWIDHVEKVEKYKVRIFTKQPFPAAVAYLASSNVVIHPHEYYAKAGQQGMNAKPIGSGPYRVVEHVLGKSIRLERNRDYFKDGPKPQATVDKVDIRFIPDAQTRVAEIVAGGVDLIMNVARDQADQLRGVPRLKIESGEVMRYGFLQMNTLPRTPAPPLRDVRVRQAIMHAVDRAKIAKFIIGEHARVLDVECFQIQFGCDDAKVRRYPYDPARAKQLLAEAGYAKGFDVDIFAFRDRNQTEAIIGYLQAVGIRAHLRFMEMAAMVTARRNGRVPLYFGHYGSYGITDASASVSFFHNFSSVDMNMDPELRDVLGRADSAIQPEARKDAYAKALTLVAERAYVLPLYSIETYYVAANDLVFKAYVDEVPRFYQMSWK